ncbi:MAG TPA: class I SAM-dependent methyltransferase [Lacipirellulaceae bacterium]|nr:class I SAM-dependent methyltransferase [Lacipirellulaceae bacterium]
MATVATKPTAVQSTSPTVRLCYDLLDIAPLCGVSDLTDGKYLDDCNDRSAYLAAQERQAEYLLDQALCERGTRLLDIGCGYGRILEQATRRSARAVGITISPLQAERCRARGLNVCELNYRNIFVLERTNPRLAPPYEGGEFRWEHAFDAIIANGSLEHFAQAADAAAGRTDEIYEEMFAICRRLLVAGGRLVTTAIHFRDVDQFDPTEILRGSLAHPRGSAKFQYATLVETFGGWYPEPGQLERCADPYFELVEEDDGTHDYHLTSEYWLRQLKRSLVTRPNVWLAVLGKWRTHPRATWLMLRSHLWDKAWYWQFRPPAPMRLLRQTWLAT